MSVTVTILDAKSMAPTPDLFVFPFVSAVYAPEATATEHPVETGIAVTDHVQVRPMRLNIDAYVTESPTATSGTLPIDMAIGFLGRALGKVCAVVIDGEGQFLPYVLEGASHSRTAMGGRGFALRFKQVRIAQAIAVGVPGKPPGTPAPKAATGSTPEAPLDAAATTTGTPASLPVAAPAAAAAGGTTSGLKLGADAAKSLATAMFSAAGY